jgi:flagellar basal-body rod modification protein FlgD
MTTTTNPILASLNRSTNATAQSGKDGSGKVDEDPQNRFLTLLVNQLKNQDPLNPMENAEVTSQMAQISTVSGIDRLNLTLESMSSSLASAQSMQAGSMIGRGVVVPGDKVDYQGGAVPLSFDLAGAAARGTVTIRDAAGQMVQTYTLEGMRTGRQTLQWDGSARVVGKAGAGEYTYDVKVRDASGATRTVASGLPASYQGAPMQLPVSGVTGERNVSVTVRNAAGATVFTRDLASLELREGAWNWGGEAFTNGTAAPGTYSFEVSAVDEIGRQVKVDRRFGFSKVESVSLADGIRVNTRGLGSVAFSDVQQVI